MVALPAAAFLATFAIGLLAVVLIAHDSGPAGPAAGRQRLQATSTARSHGPKHARRPAAVPLLAPAARQSFTRLRQQVGSRIALAVAPVGRGPVQSLGDPALARSPGAHAWSTLKVPIVVQTVLDAGGWSRLSSTQQAQAKAALTVSDNNSAMALFVALEQRHGGLTAAGKALTSLLRRGGVRHTVVNTAPVDPARAPSRYGQTQWSAVEAVRFLRTLVRGCLLPAADTRYVLGLMEQVSAERGWGIGAAGFAGRLAFKGGWGPEADGTTIAREMGVVGAGRHAVVLATVADGPDLNTAFAMNTQIAQWARQHVHRTRAPVSCQAQG